MVVTAEHLNAQVNAALSFLDEKRGLSDDINKSYYCITSLKEKLTAYVSSYNQLEINFSNLSKKNESHYLKTQDLSSKLSTLSEEKKALEVKMASLQDEFSKQLQLLGAQLQTARNDASKLKNDLLSTRNEISGLNKKHRDNLLVIKNEAKAKSEDRVKKEKKKIQTLNDEISRLKTIISSLELTVSEHENTIQGYSGKKACVVNGSVNGVKFFIHEYDVPLSLVLKDNKNRINTINGLPWHIQVMRNNGVAVASMVSEWLTPVFPSSPDFDNYWDERNTQVIHGLMMERAKTTAKKQYMITLAAKKLTITNSDQLSKEEQNWLKKAKMLTLFDSVSLCYPIFSVYLERANPDATEQQISDLHDKIKKISESFIDEKMNAFKSVVEGINSGDYKSVN